MWPQPARSTRSMAVPQSVAADPRWHQWLQGFDPPTGQERQQLFDDAIARGDHAHARMLVEQFKRACTNGMLLYGSFRRPTTTMPSENKPVYTRPQILHLHAQHRRGAYIGR